MYMYIYICIYVHIYRCIYMYVCVYIYIRKCIHTYVYSCKKYFTLPIARFDQGTFWHVWPTSAPNCYLVCLVSLFYVRRFLCGVSFDIFGLPQCGGLSLHKLQPRILRGVCGCTMRCWRLTGRLHRVPILRGQWWCSWREVICTHTQKMKMHTHAQTKVCACLQVCMLTQTYKHSHSHTHKHVHTNTHKYTHIKTYTLHHFIDFCF